MELSNKGLEQKEEWKRAGFSVPEFDRNKMIERTKEDPVWIHFGAGNIFRAFQANIVQKLLNEGSMETGIIVAEGYDYEIIEKINRPYEEWSILVTLKADGKVEKTVVGSVAESIILDRGREEEMERALEIFRKDSLQMVSFTITEKGYNLKTEDGNYVPVIEKDMQKKPELASSYMGKIAALLYERFLSGEKKIALVSMDNCSHNGDRLREAIAAFAKEWEAGEKVKKGFLSYIKNKEKVSFPWTMIDKITPRPDKKVETILEKDGIRGMQPIITEKRTYTAPFVNAEECEYLVIEDCFPNGRPPLEKAGVFFTDRETVERVEKMKVCTCLNPLHTTLAIFGCLLGYELIAEEMKDPVLRRLVERIGYEEGMPVVVDPGILDPKQFLDTVLQVRIPNPFMPDTPQRIATDTSQKLAVRFGETLKAYERSKTLKAENLEMIPLVFAGWIRYLLAVDDEGKAFVPSTDPMFITLRPYISQLQFGKAEKIHESVQPILEMEKIFGVDLYAIGLGEKVEKYLQEMIQGESAVKKTLEKYV